jgi:PQQ-like domain
MKRLIAMASLAVLGACATQVAEAPPCVELDWVLTGLSDPESAIPADEPGVLYVSNMAGEADAKDGVGFISRISADGQMLDKEWVSGLNAPKGMALSGGKLYVSDIDQLVEIDARTGQVLAKYDMPGAKFLNDVAVLGDGTVLVSDSANARIYALHDGAVDTWLEDAQLQAINGLMSEDGKVIVSTMQGKLLSVDPATRAVTQVAENLGDADGIASLGAGAYLVSEWPGRLFYVGAKGEQLTLMDTRQDDIRTNDIALLQGDVLVIANMRPGSVSAYRVLRGNLPG